MSRPSRRSLLAAGVALTAGATTGTSQASARTTTTAAAIRPPALKPGDRVKVVSPGSRPTERLVARGVQILESWGLKVELGPHVFDKLSYLAGTDANRLADLNAAFRDPGIKAVFASRGGTGSARIVQGIDFAAVQANPKPLIGFSDITVLQLALWTKCGLASIHGPMVNWDDSRTGPESAAALRSALFSTAPVQLKVREDVESAPVQVPGRAVGRLLGGNSTLLTASVGTSHFPDLRGSILLIEDVDEPPYKIDQFLTQLDQHQGLRNLAGIALGQFTNSTGNAGEWTIVELLRDKLANLGIPVLGGLPIGHGPNQLTVPFGPDATLDSGAGHLTVQAGVS